MENKLDISGVLNKAWEQFKLNVGLSLILAGIASIPSIFIDVQAELTNETSLTSDLIFEILGVLVIGLLVAVAVNYIAVAAFTASAKSDKTLSFGEAVQATLKSLPAMIAVSFVAGIFVLLGFIALIVPGIILSVLFVYILFIAVDQPKKGPLDAIKTSVRLFRSNAGLPILWMLISFALSIASGVVLFPISFALAAITSEVGAVFDSFTSTLLSMFFIMGFIQIYLYVSKASQNETSEEKTLPGKK